jgi:hypothetical protein
LNLSDSQRQLRRGTTHIVFTVVKRIDSIGEVEGLLVVVDRFLWRCQAWCARRLRPREEKLNTPKNLLLALDAMTKEEDPRPEALGVVQAVHLQRMRTIFEDGNIVGIGISEKETEKRATGELSLCFYVDKKLSKRKLRPEKLVPPVVAAPDGSGVFTDVKQTGRFRPQANVRRAPIRSGYSVGHADSTAGTVGAIVKKGKKYFILSNAHVLALQGRAKIGDKIVYPGPLDGGTVSSNYVATLSEFVLFEPGDRFVNRVDAALAELNTDRLDDFDLEIFGTRASLGVTAPSRGMKVIKRGRTSGDTESTVQDVNFRLILDYSVVGKVGFVDQVLCERYTSPGDSGSIVVDKESGRIVGLHFAGAVGGSVFNPIDAVIKALKFKFASE